jgi:hypothetical protein
MAAEYVPLWRLQRRTFPNFQDFDFAGLKGRLLSSSYAPLPGHKNFEPMTEELVRIFTRNESGGAVRFEYAFRRGRIFNIQFFSPNLNIEDATPSPFQFVLFS